MLFNPFFTQSTILTMNEETQNETVEMPFLQVTETKATLRKILLAEDASNILFEDKGLHVVLLGRTREMPSLAGGEYVLNFIQYDDVLHTRFGCSDGTFTLEQLENAIKLLRGEPIDYPTQPALVDDRDGETVRYQTLEESPSYFIADTGGGPALYTKHYWKLKQVPDTDTNITIDEAGRVMYGGRRLGKKQDVLAAFLQAQQIVLAVTAAIDAAKAEQGVPARVEAEAQPEAEAEAEA